MGDDWQSAHNALAPRETGRRAHPRACAQAILTASPNAIKACPRVYDELPPVSWTSKLKSREWEAFHVCGSAVEA